MGCGRLGSGAVAGKPGSAGTRRWHCVIRGIYSRDIERAIFQPDLFDLTEVAEPSLAEAPAREVEPSREVPEPAIPVTTAGPKWELDQEPAPAEAEVIFERNLRAKHYRLTLRRDGVPVATIPARGTERAARAFVAEHADWLARARERHRTKPRQATHWRIGTPVLWRGKWTEIRQAATSPHLKVSVGADVFRVPRFDGDLRPTIEAAFQRRAKIELPARTWELGAVTQMAVKRVSVRNQRSRWGSCTEAGVISLNWRLILSPPWVSDYVIYHELMHLKEMNHSKRFWAAVAQVCPRWQEAEAWLDQHGSYLGL